MTFLQDHGREFVSGWVGCLLVFTVGCTGGADGTPTEHRTIRSALSGGALTCTEETARDCTSPGKLRWSFPLRGPYVLDSGFRAIYTRPARYHPDGTFPAATTTENALVYVEDDLVRAIDRRTGTLRWRTVVGAGGPRLIYRPDSPAAGDGLVAVPLGVGHPDEKRWRVWVLDARTGRPVGDFAPPRRVDRVETVVDGAVVLLGKRTVVAVDPRTGQVRWRRALAPWSGATVLGGVLYADDNPDVETGTMRRIQRVDVRSGRPLPPLALPAELQGRGTLKEGVAPDLLLVDNWRGEHEPTRTGTLRGRTGRVLWTSSGEVGGVVEVDRAAAPRVAYLGTQSGDVRVARELRTGKPAAEGLAEEVFRGWGGVVVGTTVDQTDADHSGVSYLQGIEVRSGDVRWRGPAMIGFSEEGSWLDGSPTLFVGLACAPDGVRDSRPDEITPGQRCTKPRLFAINW